MFRLLGVFAVIPAALLLTLGFFVLFVLQNVVTRGLKLLGYICATMLFIGAILIISMGAYTVYTGNHPALILMKKMMKMHKEQMIGKPGMGCMKPGMPDCPMMSKGPGCCKDSEKMEMREQTAKEAGLMMHDKLPSKEK